MYNNGGVNSLHYIFEQDLTPPKKLNSRIWFICSPSGNNFLHAGRRISVMALYPTSNGDTMGQPLPTTQICLGKKCPATLFPYLDTIIECLQITKYFKNGYGYVCTKIYKTISLHPVFNENNCYIVPLIIFLSEYLPI